MIINLAPPSPADLEKQSKVMPSEAPSLRSLQLLQGAASSASLPISELDDDGGKSSSGLANQRSGGGCDVWMLYYP